MMQRNSNKSKNIIYCLFMISISLLIIIPSTAFAKQPPNPHQQSVPVQLRLIREYLVDMEDRLGTQMTEMESRLGTQMTNMEGRLDDTLLTLQITAEDIYDVVTAVNIDMTTTLCFDLNASHEESVGGHGEFGVGWPNVLDAKAILQVDGSYGFGVGIGNQICIQIPLYSVESLEPLFDFGEPHPNEFDDLIAAIAAPSQNIVPLIAAIYTELMPTPAQAVEAVGNVIEASSGYNIYTGALGSPDPVALSRPDILLDPVIPPIIKNFAANAPLIVETALDDPCLALEKTALGAVIDTTDPLYSWFCDATASALGDILTVVDTITGGVNGIVGGVGGLLTTVETGINEGINAIGTGLGLW